MTLFPASLVGSYPQPDWLIDRARALPRLPPRVRARELWRVAPEWLDQAQDDATLLAILDQERAGLDILTDGEMRRESYSNRFATALEGVDIDNPGPTADRSGHMNPVPRVVGQDPPQASGGGARREVPASQHEPPHQNHGARPVHDDPAGAERFLRHEEELALDYAAAVNEEIKDLFAAGADVVQIDEPYMQARPEKARQYGVAALNRALEGQSQARRRVHICFGYAAIVHGRPSGYSFLPELAECSVQQISIETAQSSLDCSVLEKLRGKTIILGVLDLSTHEIETPETVAARIRRALPYVIPRQSHRRAGLRHEVSAAGSRISKDAGHGGGRAAGTGGACPGGAFRLAWRLKLAAASRALYLFQARHRCLPGFQAGMEPSYGLSDRRTHSCIRRSRRVCLWFRSQETSGSAGAWGTGRQAVE